MDNTRLRIELQAPRQSLIDAIENNSEAIANMVDAGVNKAVNEFDFEKEISDIVTRHLRERIEESLTYSKFERMVRGRIRVTIKKAIDIELAKLKIEIK